MPLFPRGLLLLLTTALVDLAAGSSAADLPAVVRLPFNGTLVGLARQETIEPAAFRRASLATWWDEQAGCLREAPADVPRFERRPGQLWGTARGVLLEPPGTNLLLHSSFEEAGLPAPWQVSGGLRVTVAEPGVHGRQALRVEGQGRLYQVVDLPVQEEWPFHNSFCLSFYLRRPDGAPPSPYDAHPFAALSPDGLSEMLAADYTWDWRDRGPWVRLAGRFGNNGQRLDQARWVCGLEFASRGPVLVDAVQLEQGLGQNYVSTASSYVPTAAEPASRAGDVLQYNLRPYFNLSQGTVALWTWQPNPAVPNGYFLTMSGSPPYAMLTFQGLTWGSANPRLQGEFFPAPGAWTWLAFTWQTAPQGGLVTLYHNGRPGRNREEGPVAYSDPVTLEEVMSLSREWAEPLALTADLLVCDRALSAAEILTLFRSGPGPASPATEEE